MEHYMTVSDCAKYLGVSVQAVHKMIKSGRLKAEKIGNMYVTDKLNVELLKMKREDK